MSLNLDLEEIKKFWPKDAPNLKSVPKYVNKYKKDLIVIKYGGNVLIDRQIFNNFIDDINILNKLGTINNSCSRRRSKNRKRIKKKKINQNL